MRKESHVRRGHALRLTERQRSQIHPSWMKASDNLRKCLSVSSMILMCAVLLSRLRVEKARLSQLQRSWCCPEHKPSTLEIFRNQSRVHRFQCAAILRIPISS